MNEIARRDLFVCLGIWLALELVCFGILPALNFGRSGYSPENWLMISLPVGVGGAVLMASSAQLAAEEQWRRSSNPWGLSFITVFLSWLGLIGIGFPLFVMSIQLFTTVFRLFNA